MNLIQRPIIANKNDVLSCGAKGISRYLSVNQAVVSLLSAMTKIFEFNTKLITVSAHLQ